MHQPDFEHPQTFAQFETCDGAPMWKTFESIFQINELQVWGKFGKWIPPQFRA